jgi:hypothetical protein
MYPVIHIFGEESALLLERDYSASEVRTGDKTTPGVEPRVIALLEA